MYQKVISLSVLFIVINSCGFKTKIKGENAYSEYCEMQDTLSSQQRILLLYNSMKKQNNLNPYYLAKCPRYIASDEYLVLKIIAYLRVDETDSIPLILDQLSKNNEFEKCKLEFRNEILDLIRANDIDSSARSHYSEIFLNYITPENDISKLCDSYKSDSVYSIEVK